MRFASFKVAGKETYGIVEGERVKELGSRIGDKYPTLLDLIRVWGTRDVRLEAKGAREYRFDEVEFLPPVPGAEKILCVGINYPERSTEYKDGKEPPKYPNLFVRFPGSIVGHEQPILRPKVSEKFDYEGEIVLVIGKEGRNVPRERALEHVFGMTLGNEGSVRDWLRHGTMNVTQGKNFDRSGSMGPWIVTSDEANPGKNLHLTTRVNGELRQDDTTSRLTWDFAELIRYVTMFTTLKPGDLLFTGTPTGAGGHQTPPKWLVPGDVVEVSVPEIGALRNIVADEA